jgi:hypothetical protein
VRSYGKYEHHDRTGESALLEGEGGDDLSSSELQDGEREESGVPAGNEQKVFP